MKKVLQLSSYVGWSVAVLGGTAVAISVLQLNGNHNEVFNYVQRVLWILLPLIQLGFWSYFCTQSEIQSPIFTPLILITASLFLQLANVGAWSVIDFFSLYDDWELMSIISNISTAVMIIMILCLVVGMIWLSRFFSKDARLKAITIAIPILYIISPLVYYLAPLVVSSDIYLQIHSYYNIFDSVATYCLWGAFYLLLSSLNNKQ